MTIKLKTMLISGLKAIFYLLLLGLCLYDWLFSSDTSEFSRDLTLTDKTAEFGVDFNHHGGMEWLDNYLKDFSHLRRWYESASASVSVGDVNGDGWMDIFFPSSSFKKKSALYINHGGVGFVERAQQYGLADLPNPLRAVFLDCDNDNKLEVLVTSMACPVIYKMGSQGVYKVHSRLPTGPFCRYTLAANLVDYNRDGFIDVVLGNSTFNGLPNSPVNADNGGYRVLMKNQGQCQFTWDKKALVKDTKTHTNAIGIGDLFNTGSQDIWFATDFNQDWVYRNNKNSFERIDPGVKKSLSRSSMSSEWGYLDNEKTPFVFISDIFEPGYFVNGNTLWTVVNEKIVDKGGVLGVDRCGWSWGARFADLNNDSFLDLVVVNGFISSQHDTSAFFRVATANHIPRDIADSPQTWPSFENVSQAGSQRDCVFINSGNREFVNVAEDLEFDRELLDGRGVASVDINNDGKMDLVVINQKQKAKIYLNESEVTNYWIGFILKGVNSNTQAIGSNIFVELDGGRVLRSALYPLNGYASQNDGRVHFGVGRSKIKKIWVRWPSGRIQNVDQFKMNKYNFISEKS